MMFGKNRKYIILLIVVIICSVFIFEQIKLGHDNPIISGGNDTTITREIIGNDSLGTVEVIRNMGHPNSDKIAYVVGVHPLENDTHQTFLKEFEKVHKTLNHSYDVYIINVSMDYSKYGQLLPDDQPGRNEGQDLAYKYVYPQIVNGSYKAAIDVHAHGGAYPYDTFVFCPVDGTTGADYAHNVSAKSQNLSYYTPEYGTSGPFLTIPLNEHGVPAFYLEENSFFSQDIKDSHMLELIYGVDNLKF